LREFNLKPNSVIETLESSMATADEAELLAVPRRFPLLLLEDINKTNAGRAFEYAKVLFRGDKIKLHFEYTPEPL
jgi:GntR family transcriptional regulator